MQDHQRVKLTIEVREDQQRALQKHIPWGTQRAFFEVLIDDVITALERHGTIVVYAVLDKKMRTGECNPVLRAILAQEGTIP